MNEQKNKWPLITRIRKEWATSIHWFRPWNIASAARTSLSDGRSLTAWLTLLSEWKRNKTMKERKRRNGIYLIIIVMLSVANNIRKTIYRGFSSWRSCGCCACPPQQVQSSVKSLFILFFLSLFHTQKLSMWISVELQWGQCALLVNGETFLFLFKIRIMKQVRFMVCDLEMWTRRL